MEVCHYCAVSVEWFVWSVIFMKYTDYMDVWEFKAITMIVGLRVFLMILWNVNEMFKLLL